MPIFINNNEFKQIMEEKYKDLVRHVRHLEIEELKSEQYSNLVNPNKKHHNLQPIEKHDFSKEVFRTNILFRPTPTLGNKKHNLYIGRTEIILEYYGHPKFNLKSGFILDEERPIRVILGEYLFSEMKIPINLFLRNNNITNHLEKGEYDIFVKKALYETNRVIEQYKQYFKQGEISRD